MLEDPSYQESVNRLQNLIMDVPVHPRDTAVWWLEYLLRYLQKVVKNNIYQFKRVNQTIYS